MKFTKLLLVSFFFLPPLSHAIKLEPSDFPWVSQLKAAGVQHFQVCGSSDIQPTKKSIRKNFKVGTSKKGFLVSGLITFEEYFSILEKQNVAEAKATIEQEMKKAHLWVVDANGIAKNLGEPSKIEIPFTASVKDCVEGAKTTLGNNCSNSEGEARVVCCREKFVGPRVFWGQGKEYRLGYSPDPSVRLKVSEEKKHRYCSVQKALEI